MVGGVQFRSPQKRRHRLSAGHRHSGAGGAPSGRTRAPRRAPGRGLSAGGQSGERDVWTEVDAQTQTGLTVGRQSGLWGGRVESAAGPQAVIARPPHGDRRSDAQCGDHVVGHINVASPYRTPEINLIPYASCKLNVKEKGLLQASVSFYQKGKWLVIGLAAQAVKLAPSVRRAEEVTSHSRPLAPGGPQSSQASPLGCSEGSRGHPGAVVPLGSSSPGAALRKDGEPRRGVPGARKTLRGWPWPSTASPNE